MHTYIHTHIHGWNITLRWVKAHVGIKGNELANTLAKKAAKDETMLESYKRIPKSVVAREFEEESIRKWQREWTQTTKGRTKKDFFPDVAERLKMKINLTQKLTAIVTGHGKTRAYLQRFKIIENATCSCGKRDQTTDHLIFECELLTKERNRMKSSISQKNRWSTNKKKLIGEHYKLFTKFINEITFEEINAEETTTTTTKF